jgi:diguanylate cyclase (GGDEF)-like protein
LALNLGELRRKTEADRQNLLSIKKAIGFFKALWELPGPRQEACYRYLEMLVPVFNIDSAALATLKDEEQTPKFQAAAGMDGEKLKNLFARNWDVILETVKENDILTLSGDKTIDGANLEDIPGPLTICGLSHQSQIIGLLVLLGQVENEDKSLLETCCRLLSARIVFLEKEMYWENWEREMAAFHRIIPVAITGELEKEVIAKALETTLSLLRARRGSIFLVDQAEGRVVTDAFSGPHEALSGSVGYPRPSSVTSMVLSEDQPMLITDVSRELGPRRRRKYPYSSGSFISAPVRDNGTTLGVIHVTDREDGGDFTPWELELLSRIGLQTALAVQRSRLQREVESLKHLSITDPLTRAYNRRYLDECLQVEVSRANRFEHSLSLVMLDIDDFKDFNDAFGHTRGDRILVEIVDTIRENVRLVDIIVRYGGEEFVLILPETKLKGAVTIAEKIRAGVEGRRFSGENLNRRKKLTVSMGISTFPDMAMTTRELLERADQALLEAKKAGKNVVIPWTR